MSTFDVMLNKSVVRSHVTSWLQEDCPSMDYAGYVVGTKTEVAVLMAKSDGVLAGVPFFVDVFSELNCKLKWEEGATDGTCVGPMAGLVHLALVNGRACDILRGERLALNCLARASGVATLCRKAKQLADDCGWRGTIAGTRKTTPGFRLVEKYALAVGGVDTHRYDLSSMVMLKDNHIWSVGNVTDAVRKCRSVCGFSLKIEVECRELSEAIEAAIAGCDIIMLDHFTPEEAREAASLLKIRFPNIIIEVSGGINLDNVGRYFLDDVDVLSLGQLTQGYPAVDFSLKVLRDGREPWNTMAEATSSTST